jgi:hypothetical protein
MSKHLQKMEGSYRGIFKHLKSASAQHLIHILFDDRKEESTNKKPPMTVCYNESILSFDGEKHIQAGYCIYKRWKEGSYSCLTSHLS